MGDFRSEVLLIIFGDFIVVILIVFLVIDFDHFVINAIHHVYTPLHGVQISPGGTWNN